MIRLTLLTLAGLIGAMIIWGTESTDMRTDVIAAEVLAEPEPLTAIVQQEPEPAVEVARLQTIDLTRIKPANDLLVFEAADAPADAAIVIAEPVIVPDDAKLLVVTGNVVNLRAGPSTDVGVVGRLKRGTKAVLLAEGDDGWVQIRDVASGRIGFMSGDFLTAAN